jgi:hypothetical protein
MSMMDGSKLRVPLESVMLDRGTELVFGDACIWLKIAVLSSDPLVAAVAAAEATPVPTMRDIIPAMPVSIIADANLLIAI